MPTKMILPESADLLPQWHRILAFEPDEGFDQSLNITQLQPSDNLDFMSADQTFHTPSFGDEEFEVPTLSYNHATNIRYGGNGQGTFNNQILPYQRSSPVNHQPQQQQHLACQQQQQQQQNHHLYGPPQSPQAIMMSNGQYHHNCPSPQQTRSSPPQNMYQNEMMSPHSINMQMQQPFDGCNPYPNAPMHQAPMQQPPPMHMMHQQQHPQQQMGVHMGPPHQQQPMFSTISQTQLSNQLGMKIGMGAPGVPHHHIQGPPLSGTPPGSNHNSPCRETSEDSDDSTPLTQLMGGVKRPSPEPVDVAPKVVKKPKVPKKKKKRDPNEPQKPVSAYALFFRDTQAAIKGQSPNASFGEVSKIVASMWDGLEPEAKNIYKKKTETAKKEYLKALAAYRATLVSKAAVDQSDSMYNPNPVNSTSPPITSSPVTSPNGVMLSPLQKRSPVLTSVMESMQPVTSMSGHPQLVATSQQAWHMQSQPQMMNGNSSPQLAVVPQMNGGNMVNMQQIQQTQSSPQQMNMNRPMQQQQQMPSVPQNICHSSSNSPTYQHNVSPASVNGTHSNVSSNDMLTPVQTCLRNGCSNLAVDSPDWDREYCSNECVVSHCRDVFTAWVASRQVNTAYSTVK